MTDITSSRREVFEVVYKNLTALQNSYRHMVLECSKQLIQLESPEPKLFVDLQRNIQVANDIFTKIERVKYYSGLIILTEGTIVTESEISKTVEEIEYMLEASHVEAESTDEEIQSWAHSKVDNLERIKDVLLQVLVHKMDLRAKRGQMLWQ